MIVVQPNPVIESTDAKDLECSSNMAYGVVSSNHDQYESVDLEQEEEDYI